MGRLALPVVATPTAAPVFAVPPSLSGGRTWGGRLKVTPRARGPVSQSCRGLIFDASNPNPMAESSSSLLGREPPNRTTKCRLMSVGSLCNSYRVAIHGWSLVHDMDTLRRNLRYDTFWALGKRVYSANRIVTGCVVTSRNLGKPAQSLGYVLANGFMPHECCSTCTQPGDVPKCRERVENITPFPPALSPNRG